MNILLRKEAVRQGLKRYFNGIPCPRGHIAERLVKGSCVICDRADTLERNRRNAKKIAQNSREYRKVNPEKVAATDRAWRAAHPERVRERKAASQKRNRQAANLRNRRYHEKHRDRVNARVAAWQKANPAKSCAKTLRRHAAKLRRIPKWADHEAMGMVYQAAQIAKTTWPDVQIHVDHVLPLRGRTVSGLHTHRNLQILTAIANRTKSIHF